jgi:hypothetical protein
LGIEGDVIVGAPPPVVTIGHQVLLVSDSFKSRFYIDERMFTALIVFITLLAKPVEVESPVEIFQSIRDVETVASGINPVAGNE